MFMSGTVLHLIATCIASTATLLVEAGGGEIMTFLGSPVPLLVLVDGMVSSPCRWFLAWSAGVFLLCSFQAVSSVGDALHRTTMYTTTWKDKPDHLPYSAVLNLVLFRCFEPSGPNSRSHPIFACIPFLVSHNATNASFPPYATFFFFGGLTFVTQPLHHFSMSIILALAGRKCII